MKMQLQLFLYAEKEVRNTVFGRQQCPKIELNC